MFDANYVNGNVDEIQDLLPFILPMKKKHGLHYVVANKLKGSKIKIYDPQKASQYYLSLQEIKKRAHFKRNDWDIADTEDRIREICRNELADFHIDYPAALVENGPAVLFNKLTYFKYLRGNFGFKDKDAEKAFLEDLLKNQEISSVPSNFKALELEKGKIRNTSPLILSIKSDDTQKPEDAVDYPQDKTRNLYWQLFKQLGAYKKLWYIYIFAALFSATTAQIAVFTNQILIDNVLPTYNLHTLVLFAIGLGIYKMFDTFTTVYKNFVSIHLSNVLDRYFLFSFDEKINRSSLAYIHSYKKGDLMERVSDSLKLKTFFMKFFTGTLVDVIVSLYSLVILFFIDKTLTLIVLAVMISFVLWFKFITPYLKQNERMRYMRKADFISRMMEKVEGIQVIRASRSRTFTQARYFPAPTTT